METNRHQLSAIRLCDFGRDLSVADCRRDSRSLRTDVILISCQGCIGQILEKIVNIVRHGVLRDFPPRDSAQIFIQFRDNTFVPCNENTLLVRWTAISQQYGLNCRTSNGLNPTWITLLKKVKGLALSPFRGNATVLGEKNMPVLDAVFLTQS